MASVPSSPPGHTAPRARNDPSPVREGPEMWLASLVKAPVASSHGRLCVRSAGLTACNTIAAAASPGLSPQRSAENGRHGASSSALNARKPLMMKADCSSAPTMTAASQISVAMRRCASTCAATPEIQASDTTTGVMASSPAMRAMRCAVAGSGRRAAAAHLSLPSSSSCSRAVLPLVEDRMSRVRSRGTVRAPGWRRALLRATSAIFSKKVLSE